MKPILYVAGLVLLSTLVGCASQPPAPIRKIPAGDPSVAAVRANLGGAMNVEVRWGGVITQVDNKPDQTWVEIISRKLQANGRPQAQGESGGRFIASFQGFADPLVYQPGRELTVLGTVEGQTSRLIGEYAYHLPVVAVTGFHLWPPQAEPLHYDDDPFWWRYDPWPYYPWPYYPWPYSPYYW